MKLGRYEVVRPLARGGFGSVFLARGEDGREVAIKVLHRRDAAAVARFEREARLHDSLGEDAGFVPFLAAGDANEGPYIVMGLAAGGSLRQRLEKGPFAVEDALLLARSLAAALARAHERGIVHRDLKPDNILFSADGRALVADLGLAKHFTEDAPGAAASVSLSRSRELRGTAGYMAPEQMRDAKSVGPPVDVFAIGAIVYECLAGAPAFGGETILALLDRVERGDFEPLSRARPEVPRAFARVIERSLAKDPRSRYADGAALLGALEDALVPRSSRAPVFAAALAAILVAAGAIVVSRGGAGPPSLVRPTAPVASSQPSRDLPLFADRFYGDGTLRAVRVVGSPAWKALDQIGALAFSPDGRTVYTGGWDGQVLAWDTSGDGVEPAVLGDGGASIRALAVSPDGKLVATADGGSLLRIFDARARREANHVKLEGAGRRVAFAADGARVLVGTKAPACEMLSLETLEPIAVLKADAIGYSADGEKVIAMTGGEDTELIDAHVGTRIVRMKGYKTTARVAVLSPDRMRVYSGTEGGGLVAAEVASGKQIYARDAHGQTLDVAVSPDGKLVLTGGYEGTCKLWRAADGAPLATFGTRGPVHAVAFSPDGKLAAVGGADQTLHLLDAATLQPRNTTAGHGGAVGGVAFVEGGKTLAAVDVLRTVARWNLVGDARWIASATSAVPGPGSGNLPAPVAISSDGTLAAGVTREHGGTRLWDPATGNETRFLFVQFSSAAFTSDAHGLAVTLEDGRARQYDTVSGRTIFEYEMGGSPSATAPIADEAGVLVGRADGSGLFYSLSTDPRPVDLGTKMRVTALASLGDGKKIAVATQDGLLRILSLGSGIRGAPRETARLVFGTDRPTSLAFSESGRLLACGTARGVAYVLELPP